MVQSSTFLSEAENGGGQKGQQLQRVVSNDEIPEIEQLRRWKMAGECAHDPTEDDLKIFTSALNAAFYGCRSPNQQIISFLH
jgi:hypothetical protein